jgi:hypothetical protein
MSTYFTLRLNPCYTVEDAVEQFRTHQEIPENPSGTDEGKLEPMNAGAWCPWCDKGGMRITQVPIEERIQKLIGGYRIAQCQACGAMAVTLAKQGFWKNLLKEIEEKERLEKAKYEAWLKTTDAKEYFVMLRDWYTKNGWEPDRYIKKGLLVTGGDQ